MNLKAQRDLSIAGDVVGHDKITINITRGLDELPTRYDSRVQNFLEYYLGAKDHPAPFGGRASDLAALDAWLDDPAAPPYASLIAPAGRGKSALLAHWVTRLDSRPATGAEAVHVVYFPISIRFNTNLETVVFASLAGRMAHVYGEKVTQATDAQQYRGVFSDYLRRTPSNGGRVLVVLDGLDEAAGWEAGADLFPIDAPGHLRVIVAARPLALDKDETAWLNRLGWEMPNRAQRISLAGLDREGVRDVLSQMGNPLDALATKIDLVSRLYELSEGDPLLMRLYVEAMLPKGAAAAFLTPNNLAKLQPGLEAYFKRWFEEQQKLWGAAKPLQDKTVRGLLNLCAVALGPLKKDDVLALVPDIFEDSGLLDEAATEVNRFIIGDGVASGYSFCHPRYGEYFATKLTERERQAWQARFLQYGRDTLTALENKTLLPKNAPAYVVQYYGAHLAQAKAPANDFYALVCEGWLRAWEWLEGTPAGFLNDAYRAWQQAEAEGPFALGHQIRAALCFASVTSLSANISKDLLVACVKAGVISSALGLVMARQKPYPKERAECLAAIAQFHPLESQAIMNEALSVARVIFNEWPRALVLSELVPQLPENLLGEAFSAVCTISDEKDRAYVLMTLASQLPQSLLGEALSAARAISNEWPRAIVLGAVGSRLPKREQAEVLCEALSLARLIFDEEPRARVLGYLALQLPEHEQLDVLEEALSAACKISDEWSCADVLQALAPSLSGSLLQQALSVARAISNKWSRAIVLGELAARLPAHERDDVFNEALSVANSISYEETRADVFKKLAPRWPESLLEEVLRAACAIFDEDHRAEVLKQLATYLSEKLVGEVLSVARAISNEKPRARALGAIAPRLPEREQMKVLNEALLAARAISEKDHRAEILEELAPKLPEYERAKVLKEALLAASAISDEDSRACSLGELALGLPESEQVEMLGEALSTACAIFDERTRAYVLGALAPWLPPSLLKKALSAARAISDKRSRARVLGAFNPWLPQTLLKRMFSTAPSNLPEWHHLRVLGALVQRASETLFRKALSANWIISDEWPRINILGLFASLLPHSVLKKALSGACAIADENFRAYILWELALGLPKSLLRETLLATRTIPDEWSRARIMETLAPRLPESALGEALLETRAISDENSHARVLGA